jgi:integrase
VALDPWTIGVLKGRAARRAVVQATAKGSADTGLIFTREDGDAPHPEVLGRFFRQAVIRTALPTIRLHDLRHTHATLALCAGIHPKVASERLGHATVAITLDIYSHAIPALQEEAAALIAGLVLAPH